MSGAKYLQATIAEARRAPIDSRRYMTRDGYTRRSGAPSSIVVRLEGEKRFRRLMVWQFSNAGTCFLRVRGEALIVPEYRIPPVTEPEARPTCTEPEAEPEHADDDPNGKPSAVIDYDADDDPFFVCAACGLRSFHARGIEDRRFVSCAHCVVEHVVT